MNANDAPPIVGTSYMLDKSVGGQRFFAFMPFGYTKHVTNGGQKSVAHHITSLLEAGASKTAFPSLSLGTRVLPI